MCKYCLDYSGDILISYLCVGVFFWCVYIHICVCAPVHGKAQLKKQTLIYYLNCYPSPPCPIPIFFSLLPGSYSVAQASLEFVTLFLPQPLEYWNYRHESACSSIVQISDILIDSYFSIYRWIEWWEQWWSSIKMLSAVPGIISIFSCYSVHVSVIVIVFLFCFLK